MDQLVPRACSRRDAARLLEPGGPLDRDLSEWTTGGGRVRVRLLAGGPALRGPRGDVAVDGAAAGLLALLASRQLGVGLSDAAARLFPDDEPAAACEAVREAVAELRAALDQCALGGESRLTTSTGLSSPVFRLAGVLCDTSLFRRLRLRAAAGSAAACDAALDLSRDLPRSGADMPWAELWHAAAYQLAVAELGDGRNIGPDGAAPGAVPARAEVQPVGAADGLVCTGSWVPAELGRPPAGWCVLHGGDTDRAGTRLLTLPELRRALDVPPVPGGSRPSLAPRPSSAVDVAAPAVVAGHGLPALFDRPAAAEVRPCDGERPTAAPLHNATPPVAVWLSVVGAHGGAGTSTVALALSDAAAGTGRRVHLLTCAGDAVLGAVTDRELGVDPTGRWRTGRRGRSVTVRRRIGGAVAEHRPVLDTDPGADLIVDLPAQDSAADGQLTGAGPVVVVCRLSVPGIVGAEARLASLAGAGCRVMVVVGHARWPGEVQAAAGPQVRALQAAGRVVAVPLDRTLAVRGPTAGPLPQPILRAARLVLSLLEAEASQPPDSAGMPLPPAHNPVLPAQPLLEALS